MVIELFKKFDPYKNIFAKDEKGREINIYKLENCIPTGINLFYPNVLFTHFRISNSSLIMTDNQFETDETLILPLVERTMSLQSGTIYEKMNMNFEAPPLTLQHNDENPLFFFIYNTDNYFHFLYDSLPYLISYLQLKKEIPELKLLMQYPNEQKKSFYPFVLEFLEILSIEKEDIVLIDPHTEYKTIYISTSYTHDIDSNLPPRKEIYPFYQEMVLTVKQLHHSSIDTPRKIYVSRRSWIHGDVSNIGTNYTTRRKLINEDELVEKLVANGFTEVFTEKLTTVEKILYFANATHVVGAIGGGISNVLFSPPSTKLEALVSPTFLTVNKRFVYSLDCVDVLYNTNTEHMSSGNYTIYMRVKTKDGTIVGEIEKIDDDTLLISYTDGSNTGWNAQSIYRQIKVNQSDVVKLDDGLNSPWRIDLSTLKYVDY